MPKAEGRKDNTNQTKRFLGCTLIGMPLQRRNLVSELHSTFLVVSIELFQSNEPFSESPSRMAMAEGYVVKVLYDDSAIEPQWVLATLESAFSLLVWIRQYFPAWTKRRRRRQSGGCCRMLDSPSSSNLLDPPPTPVPIAQKCFSNAPPTAERARSSVVATPAAGVFVPFHDVCYPFLKMMAAKIGEMACRIPCCNLAADACTAHSPVGADSEAGLFLCITEVGRGRQSKDHNLFAGCRADVVVQAHHFDAGDLLDHRFHYGPRRFDQVGADLFQEVSPLLGRERFDQLLFGHSQDPFEANNDQIADHVSVDVFWASAHVILFEAGDSFTDGCFHLSLCLHAILRYVLFGREKPATRGATGGSRKSPQLVGVAGRMIPQGQWGNSRFAFVLFSAK
jgi:hypothetical protein